MDAGAHFHRCDFQVHSPRDINWTGPRPTTDEDRMAWAERFVAKCRELGLHAVAITDHHDMTFVEPVRQAAKAERDEDGALYPPEERLVAFPGMELTLAVPCQALLLLDSDFPANMLPAVASALGITGNDPNEPQHAQTQQLDHITSLHDICKRLDTLDYARGCYIPRLSDRAGGGTKTPELRRKITLATGRWRNNFSIRNNSAFSCPGFPPQRTSQ